MWRDGASESSRNPFFVWAANREICLPTMISPARRWSRKRESERVRVNEREAESEWERESRSRNGETAGACDRERATVKLQGHWQPVEDLKWKRGERGGRERLREGEKEREGGRERLREILWDTLCLQYGLKLEGTVSILLTRETGRRADRHTDNLGGGWPSLVGDNVFTTAIHSFEVLQYYPLKQCTP